MYYRLFPNNSITISTRFSTVSFLDKLFVLIINPTLKSLSGQAATWLHNFLLIALHFIYNPLSMSCMVLYMWGGGRIVLVFVTAPCTVGTQAANISAAVATSRSVTDIRTVGAVWPPIATRDFFRITDV
jgi:hypothetical protein